MEHQHDLLQQLEFDLLHQDNAPILDLEVELIGAVNRSIRSCGIGRDHFVDRVNLCLRTTNKKITKTQINKWLALSQDNCIPAWVMPSVCWAVNSIDPMTALLNPLGFKPMDVRADMLRNKAQHDIEAKIAQQQSKALERAMMELMRAKNDK